ncbi:nucleotidyltransferase family protein [Ornithinimicrobium sp. Y1847]|uniref:nucleotidyltransferase family protein n=1 Tax=Ornithinimicrobium sp. Y1847 TaxID=3405419 RepID=UPI003B6749D3
MTTAAEVPSHVRPHLMHAFLQHVADRSGIDVLHIKGASVHPDLLARDGDGAPRWRPSVDADLLVRPEDASRMLRILAEHGCTQWSSFVSGSPFEHAANVTHESFGGADVHRWFPGFRVAPGRVFDQLWERRQVVPIAHRECGTPDLLDQRLILLLHAARSGSAKAGDKVRAWDEADDDTRRRIRQRADELGATVGLAAAIGELDLHRRDRTYRLWHLFSRQTDHSRTEEWVARVMAARNPLHAASVLGRSVLPNTDWLAIELGRPPTRAEIRRAWLGRFTRAVRERRGHGIRDRGPGAEAEGEAR